MKKSLIASVVLFLAAAAPPAEGVKKKLSEVLLAQIVSACDPAGSVEKTVTDYTAEKNHDPQKRTLKLTCGGVPSESEITLDRELAFATEYDAESEYQKEYFSKVQNGTCTEYFRTAGSAGRTPLMYQALERDPGTGVIRYLESVIRKDGFMYDLDVHIAVSFDAEGRYEWHLLETCTQVALRSGKACTLVEGLVL